MKKKKEFLFFFLYCFVEKKKCTETPPLSTHTFDENMVGGERRVCGGKQFTQKTMKCIF